MVYLTDAAQNGVGIVAALCVIVPPLLASYFRRELSEHLRWGKSNNITGNLMGYLFLTIVLATLWIAPLGALIFLLKALGYYLLPFPLWEWGYVVIETDILRDF